MFTPPDCRIYPASYEVCVEPSDLISQDTVDNALEEMKICLSFDEGDPSVTEQTYLARKLSYDAALSMSRGVYKFGACVNIKAFWFV